MSKSGLFSRLIALGACLCCVPQWALAASAQRIVAVGDLHGDYSAWTDIARAAGIEDASGHWSGGKTTLVQLGDIADRGPDTLKIIGNLRQLQTEAPKSGGRVVVLLGNHEAMNLTGDLRYVSAGEYAAFATPQSVAMRDRYYTANKARIEASAQRGNSSASPAAIRDKFMATTPLGWVEHEAAWSPNGAIGRWVRTNPAIVKIDDTIFVHGGVGAEMARIPIDELNRKIALAMAKADGRPNSILFDPLGPLWYRGLVTRDADAESARAAARAPKQTAEAELNGVLAAYGAKRMVVAHTPNLRGIVILYNGRLARVDTGNSRYYGGQLSWLEIDGEQLTAHQARRSAP